MAIHAFLLLALIVDITGYVIVKDPAYTTQTFTSTILLLHVLSFIFRFITVIVMLQSVNYLFYKNDNDIKYS